MKRLMVCITLALLPRIAAADWNIIADGASLADTSGGFSLQIAAGKDFGIPVMSAFVVTERVPLCESSMTRLEKPELYDSWEINGKPVKIARICNGLQLVLFPYSREGQEYLASQIKSNRNITIRLRTTPQPFVFINTNGSDAVYKATNNPEAI